MAGYFMGFLTHLSLILLVLLSACAPLPFANGLDKQASASVSSPVPLPPMLVVADGARVNVRSGPGTEYAVVSVIAGPTEVVIYEFYVEWCRISPPLETSQYVRCEWDGVEWTTVYNPLNP